jgi:flagellar assembly protein FliH
VSRPLTLETFGDDAGAGPVEDFGAGLAPPAETPLPGPAPAPPAAGEEYERGYQAGWDDCDRQADEARQAIGAELARNLQELGFTFHEARAHVLSGVEPLLTAMVEKILPRIAAATLGASIVEELTAMTEALGDLPVTILVAPASHDLVAGLLAAETALPFTLTVEETLTDQQVFFRLGEHERQLDLGDVTERIAARLAAFADQTERVLKHG